MSKDDDYSPWRELLKDLQAAFKQLNPEALAEEEAKVERLRRADRRTKERPTRWVSSQEFPRRFYLDRKKDHSGVSGTGVVATGVQFPDGTCAVRWNGKDASTSLWANVDSLKAVHGHEGSTDIVFVD
jgi:hypothetical protein